MADSTTSPEEREQLRQMKRAGIMMWLGFLPMFVLTFLLAKYVNQALSVALLASYIGLNVGWILFRMRCPRCGFQLGRRIAVTSRTPESCPRCRIDLTELRL
jgi:hypothetical protein